MFFSRLIFTFIAHFIYISVIKTIFHSLTGRPVQHCLVELLFFRFLTNYDSLIYCTDICEAYLGCLFKFMLKWKFHSFKFTNQTIPLQKVWFVCNLPEGKFLRFDNIFIDPKSCGNCCCSFFSFDETGVFFHWILISILRPSQYRPTRSIHGLITFDELIVTHS